MIKEEYKELLFRTILAIILLIAVFILGFYFIFAIKNNKEEPQIKEENKVPQIKEDFKSTTLNKYKSYNNRISINNNNNEIILDSNDDNISHYIIGKNGIIFNNSLPIHIIKEKNNYKNYEVNYKNNKFYYIDKTNNIMSNYYDEIIPIKTNNQYNYLLLYVDKIYSLLNINTEELIEFDNEIQFDKNNDSYLIVKNKDKKYGLIDYNANQILDYKYDYLDTYISNDKFIAKINNKYGIINNKEEILVDFDNDKIIYNNSLENYSIFIKNKKIGIYYKDKLIINYKFDYQNNNENAINYIINDDRLYLTVLHNNYDNITNYIIDKNGLQTTSEKIYESLYIDQELKYFYIINDNKITYYDLDYNELYSITMNNKINNDISIELINEKTSLIKHKKDLYYIDLFNSRQIKEIDALYTYFDNGYSFILNTNKELKIYKNNEIISTYNNIDLYLGNYYFLSNNYNEETDIYESIIYNIDFNKKN